MSNSSAEHGRQEEEEEEGLGFPEQETKEWQFFLTPTGDRRQPAREKRNAKIFSETELAVRDLARAWGKNRNDICTVMRGELLKAVGLDITTMISPSLSHYHTKECGKDKEYRAFVTLKDTPWIVSSDNEMAIATLCDCLIRQHDFFHNDCCAKEPYMTRTAAALDQMCLRLLDLGSEQRQTSSLTWIASSSCR